MNFETIRYAVDDGIATITLSRPDRLNAFSARMLDELLDALDRVDGDDDVRAAVVTGAGRAFCAGADISGGTDGFMAADGDAEPRDGGGRLTLRLFDCLKPLVAAINGAAVGVGATMTLPMDVRIASTAARIGFVFARRGIVPEAASSWFLPRVVGIAQALDWCYRAELIDAEEALRGGLLSAVHPPDALLAQAYRIARRFTDGNAPVSVALTRRLMWRGLGQAHPIEAHRADSRAIASRSRSADATEGVSSFLEKRPPSFPDRVSRDLPDDGGWWGERHGG